ncbi:uncharacterized protein [Dermacentor andersoni]|uniref:uncharacterized protein n=1 Tax=Dermacentor andersoni TaxID=34620 RepID=UPI003B3BA5CF
MAADPQRLRLVLGPLPRKGLRRSCLSRLSLPTVAVEQRSPMDEGQGASAAASDAGWEVLGPSSLFSQLDDPELELRVRAAQQGLPGTSGMPGCRWMLHDYDVSLCRVHQAGQFYYSCFLVLRIFVGLLNLTRRAFYIDQAVLPLIFTTRPVPRTTVPQIVPNVFTELLYRKKLAALCAHI